VRKLLWNWPVWLGFLFSLLAFITYSLIFARFPATRNVPWVNFLLFGVSATFLFFGFLSECLVVRNRSWGKS
jgi:hypothetical protein